jgi:hypothetical protein
VVVLTQRADKDFCLRRSWIGGGISSRDQYTSVRRENKVSCKEFQQIGATIAGSRRTVFVCVYVGFSGDKHPCTSLLKERRVHLGKCE